MAKKVTVLTKEQAAFLEFISQFTNIALSYYLTGGTPLSAFYLQHRYSEDLDFFIENQEVNLLAIQRVIKEAQKSFALKKISYQNYQGLHMFFLTFPNGVELKVDFNYYPFPRIEKGMTQFGVSIDSLYDIAVNKVQSIAMRTTARDFVDIYFILKEKGKDMQELMQMARNKFDWTIEPIQYGKQFLKVTTLKDYPRMIKKLNKKDLDSFFISEAKRLKKDLIL